MHICFLCKQRHFSFDIVDTDYISPFFTSLLLICVHLCTLGPVDGDGIVPDELEQQLEANLSTRSTEIRGNRPFQAMLYLIPTFHNPAGVCLSPGM